MLTSQNLARQRSLAAEWDGVIAPLLRASLFVGLTAVLLPGIASAQSSKEVVDEIVEASGLGDEVAGAAIIERDGKMVLVAVGEGVPAQGTKGLVAERTARLAAFTVAKGELIRLLKGMTIEARTEAIRSVTTTDTDRGSTVTIEETTRESYNAFCEGALRAAIPLVSMYDPEEELARSVVLAIPEDALGFDRFGPGVRVSESVEEAMDTLEREALEGSIPPTGASVVVIRNEGGPDQTWLIAWGSGASKGGLRFGGTKARALRAFASGEELSIQDSFSSEFSKLLQQHEEASSEFHAGAETLSVRERTKSSSAVRAKSVGVSRTLRQPRRLGDSGWIMVFTGFEYTLAAPGSGPPAASWGGLGRSLESALEKAKAWSLSGTEVSAIGTSRAFGTRATGPWGVGVAIAPIPEDDRIKAEVEDSLTLMARAAAVRGLAITLGKENRSTVEASIIGKFKMQVYDDNGRFRVFALISTAEISDLRTYGEMIGAE
jgi:hypothetical protein